MKIQDVVGADPGPIAGPLIDEPPSYVKRSSRAVFIKNPASDGSRTFGCIVECKADHWAFVAQLKRRGEQVSGQPVADPRFRRRPHQLHDGTVLSQAHNKIRFFEIWLLLQRMTEAFASRTRNHGSSLSIT
jgi:hypothetical protein